MRLRFGQWAFVLIMLPPLLTWTALSMLSDLVSEKLPWKIRQGRGTSF